VIEARRAADKVLKLEPEFGDIYATSCLLHSETRLAECEDQMRNGSRIDPDAPYLNGFLADMLKGVGRFEEAVKVSRLSYTHDPYDFFKIIQMLRMLEYTGDHEGAHELYQRAIRWYPDSKFRFFRNRMFGLIYIGDFEAMQRLEQEVGADVLPAEYKKTASIVAAMKSKSQSALRRACTTSEFLVSLRCMIALATIGDSDGAYAIADKLYPNRLGRTPAETERIWLDNPEYGPPDYITSAAAAPMRRDPRYLQLAERTGLRAYWRSGRRPDFCRKNPESICAQLLKRT
jgi:tetratricopeptide (TPR) repeat protein